MNYTISGVGNSDSGWYGCLQTPVRVQDNNHDDLTDEERKKYTRPVNARLGNKVIVLESPHVEWVNQSDTYIQTLRGGSSIDLPLVCRVRLSLGDQVSVKVLARNQTSGTVVDLMASFATITSRDTLESEYGTDAQGKRVEIAFLKRQTRTIDYSGSVRLNLTWDSYDLVCSASSSRFDWLASNDILRLQLSDPHDFPAEAVRADSAGDRFAACPARVEVGKTDAEAVLACDVAVEDAGAFVDTNRWRWVVYNVQARTRKRCSLQDQKACAEASAYVLPLKPTQVSSGKVRFQLRIKSLDYTIDKERYELEFVPLGTKDHYYTSHTFELVRANPGALKENKGNPNAASAVSVVHLRDACTLSILLLFISLFISSFRS